MADQAITRGELTAALSAQTTDVLNAVRQMFVEQNGQIERKFVEQNEQIERRFVEQNHQILQQVQNMFVAEREHTEEFIRDAQTEILRAVEPFQKQVAIRFRAEDARVSNLSAEMAARMEILENRLSEIEKRLLLDPPAA